MEIILRLFQQFCSVSRVFRIACRTLPRLKVGVGKLPRGNLFTLMNIVTPFSGMPLRGAHGRYFGDQLGGFDGLGDMR
jgi:hypothetical protein